MSFDGLTIKKTIFVAIFLAAFCVPGRGVSFGAGLEIKGVRIGMPEEGWQTTFGDLAPEYFTVGGVRGKYGNPKAYFLESKLDRFYFFFESKQFETVLKAVKSKYPKLSCSETPVTTLRGAAFTQVTCNLRDSTGALVLRRFHPEDINTSSLSLLSDRLLKETEQETDRDRNDI